MHFKLCACYVALPVKHLPRKTWDTPAYVPCRVLCCAAATCCPLPSATLLCSARPSTARRLLQKKYQLSPDPDNKGCYLYRAQSGDTIDDIGKALGVSPADLKERNAKNIADFSRLSGRFVEICGITSKQRHFGG